LQDTAISGRKHKPQAVLSKNEIETLRFALCMEHSDTWTYLKWKKEGFTEEVAIIANERRRAEINMYMRRNDWNTAPFNHYKDMPSGLLWNAKTVGSPSVEAGEKACSLTYPSCWQKPQ
jgi:hypothetical protein